MEQLSFFTTPTFEVGDRVIVDGHKAIVIGTYSKHHRYDVCWWLAELRKAVVKQLTVDQMVMADNQRSDLSFYEWIGYSPKKEG